MDAAKEIIADPSEDIGRLSASLAELNHEARGLAKVNVDKLESVHSTGTTDVEEGGEQVQVPVVKSEEDSGGGAPPSVNVGKVKGSIDDESRGEIGEDAGESEIGSQLTPPSKSREEEAAAALDEVLGKIGAPREQDGKDSGVQDLTEPNLGKMEGVEEEERGTPQQGLGDGPVDVGDKAVTKAETRREPGAKLKEDAAKARARDGAPVLEEEILDDILEEILEGKTEHKDFGKAETGKPKETGEEGEELATSGEFPIGKEENLRKLYQSLGSDSYTDIVGKTEGKEFVSTPGSFIDAAALRKHKEKHESGVGQAEMQQSAPGKIQEDVGKALNQNASGKFEEDAGKFSGPDATAPTKLEENLRKLYQSQGSDSYTGIVGKTEGKEFVSTPGSFIDAQALRKHKEKHGSSVGQAEIQESTPGKIQEDVGKALNQNASGKLQEDAGKSAGQDAIPPTKLEEKLREIYQSLGSDSYIGIVGKTEGKEFVSTPGSFVDAKGAAGKHEEGDESSAGQANIRSNTVGKVQEDVDKAVNQQNVPGKVQEDVDQTTNVKHQQETDGATVRAQKKSPGISHQLASERSADEAGKVEASDKAQVGHQLKTAVEDSADNRRGVGKNDTDTSGLRGHGGHGGTVIYLASKGPAEEKYVDKLKHGEGLQLPDGARVIAAAEVTDGSWTEAFDINRYLKNLLSNGFGRFVLYSPLVASTHTLLSQNFHSFPTGTLCVADAQLQGKGRAGNVWQSPKGCLMFSFTIQMTNGRLVPFLQYVVSLAVIEGVEHVCKAGNAPSPDLKIKWPNDLYAKGIKVGGVLCTSSYRAKTFNIVVGIGLNVGNREPTTCLDAIIQELDPKAHAIQLEDLLAAIMYKFEGLNTVFQDQGFKPLQDAYYGKWMHGGQRVILEEEKSGTSNVSQVPLTIQGLTNMGFLLATDNEGEQYELHPDGNTFDFLKGLVRQKVSS